MNIALAQIAPVLSKKNIVRHLNIIRSIDADLIVFPELSLNGYFLQNKVKEDFWSYNELHELEKVSVDKDIVVGAVLKERKRIYNTAIYFSSGTIQHIHKKVQLPNYGMFEEARFFEKGKKFSKFESPKFGRVVMAICEDLWSAKSLHKIAKIDPDIVIVISNSPARGFGDGEIEIVNQWKSILITASILWKATVVFVNRVGFEDGLGFWGGSMIVENGKIIEQLPLYDEVVKVFELKGV